MGSFKPLIAGRWLTIFMWVFSIIAIISLIWFVLYATRSKKREPKTSITGVVFTSLLIAIAAQLIMIENNTIIQ